MRARRNSILLAWRGRALMLGASMGAIAVAASAAFAQDIIELDPITVLSTKLPQTAIDSLAGISTLREEQLREIAADRPAQLFTGMPGVSTEATAQDPGTAVNIRGLQDFGRVAVIVDGARQNFARAGHDGSGSFYLEPELLAGVDVVRGPVSNIYGSGAIGGVASFRTKDVDDMLKAGERWGVSTYGTIGSNLFRGAGSVFGAVRANPNVDLLVGGTYRHLDDYKDGDGNRIPNSGQTVATGIAKVTVRPADGHEVKFGAIHYDADWTHGIRDLTSVVRDSRAKNTTTTASWSYSRPDDRLFDFRHSAYWNRVDVNTLVTWLAPPAGTTNPANYFGPVGSRAGYKLDTFGYDAHNTSRFDTGALRHELTFGGDVFSDEVDNRDPGGYGDGYNPSGRRQVWGAFAQLRSRYSTWLEATTALRYDNYSLTGTDFRGGAVNASGDRVSPKFTLGISPLEWLTFYGTYAEGYRAPAVTETLISSQHPPPAQFIFQPNPNLRPEIGKTKEVGLNIKQDDLFKAGDRLRIKASLFRNDVEDFIDTVSGCRFTARALCFAFGGFGPPNWANWDTQYRNVAKARIEGAELESSYDAGGWFVGLNAHRLRGKNLTDNEPLAKIPTDMVAGTVGLRSPDRKWTVALRWAHYAAKTMEDLPASATVDQAVGSYNLVNLHLAYQPTENVIAALSVDNLLNETYRVYTHQYNSAGLTVKGSLRVRFAGAEPRTGG